MMQHPEVDFCGYSVPHPYEPKMNIRVQTQGNTPAIESLKIGLKEMEIMCNIIDEAFDNAVREFNS